jgi:hypothetical protein
LGKDMGYKAEPFKKMWKEYWRMSPSARQKLDFNQGWRKWLKNFGITEAINEAADTKKRFMFDFYNDSNERNTQRETNYITDSLESAIKAAHHICKVTGYAYVEIYYRHLFLGSMHKKNRYKFIPGKGYITFKHGTTEVVDEGKILVKNLKTGETSVVLDGKGKGDLLIAMSALQKAAPAHMKYFIKETQVNEGVTPQFKALIKRAKALRIDSADELRDLIADEFDDESKPITGADYEIAKDYLKIKESKINESKSIESWVGELDNIRYNGKQVRGYPVFLRVGGHVTQTVGVFTDKKKAEKMVDKLKAKYGILNQLKHLDEAHTYSDQTGVKLSILGTPEFGELINNEERRFIGNSQTKLFAGDHGVFVFTDGKREIVFNLRKPYSKLKRLGIARSEIKSIYNQKSENITEVKFYAFWNGKRYDIDAKDLWDAKQKAILQLKVPKSKAGLIAVVSAASQDSGDFKFLEGVTVESGIRSLVYHIDEKACEKFFRKYPNVKKAMVSVIKANPKDVMTGYRKFLKFKNAHEEKLGGRPQVTNSPTFGSKTFYKYDWEDQSYSIRGHWPELFQYLYNKMQ